MAEAMRDGLRVAVVGAGISGLSAAYLLSRRPGHASLRGIPARRPMAA